MNETDRRYEQAINRQELERIWWEDLMQNTWLSSTQKVVLYAIRHIIQGLRDDWHLPTCEAVLIYNTELQHKCGLKKDAVLEATKTLNEIGLIKKDTKGRGKDQRTYYTLHGSIKHSVKNLTIAAPSRNHGGLRCSKCGSKNIIIKTIHTCQDCGHTERV